MMTQQQKFKNENNDSTKIFEFDEVTTCPMCKHAIKPHVLHGVYFNEKIGELISQFIISVRHVLLHLSPTIKTSRKKNIFI